MLQKYIIQVIAAGLGAGGYSILFNIRRDKLYSPQPEVRLHG